ncbi:Acyl-CoA synthetase family member 2,mitochondrial [Aphelenchoides fujianensis]|nr:Acyl-CoA synthetase family member 2,mitochondrial [Aphelenchoides fujianensis]
MPLKSEFPAVPIDARPFFTQFLEKLWLHSLNDPNKPALINAHNPEDRVTFRELFLFSHSLATFLRSKGFGHHDVALIATWNSWQYMAAFGGVTLAGGALSGASYLFTEYELQRQILDCGASVVFCGEALLEKTRSAIKKCPKVKTIVVIAEKPTNKFSGQNVFNFADVIRTEPKINSSVKHDVKKDVVLIPYSSGTTGLPKGVVLSHYNMSATIGAVDAAYKATIFPKLGIAGRVEDETFLLIMPLYHVYGNSVCLHSLMSGATSVVMKSFEPELFCASIQKYKVKLLKLVPPIMVFLAKSPVVDKYDLSSLLFLSSGAAPLGADLAQEVLKRLPHVKFISQGYGMSEASVASHFPYLSEKLNAAACGKLMPNMQQKIVHVETGKEQPLGQPGEICVKGPNVSKNGKECKQLAVCR